MIVEAKKEREIQKLTAELQRMSTEVEAQKEQSKLLKSYVDVSAACDYVSCCLF